MTARSTDREELPQEFTIETSRGEIITYRSGNEGYWSATQKGMPDHWALSRVASRAVEELAALQSENERLKETALTRDEAEAAWHFWSYGATRGNHSDIDGRPCGPVPGPLTPYIDTMGLATKKFNALRSLTSEETTRDV